MFCRLYFLSNFHFHCYLNVIADSVLVPSADWLPDTSALRHTYVFADPKLTQSLIRGSALVMSLNVPGSIITYSVPYIDGNLSVDYYLVPGKIIFLQNNSATPFFPYSLNFHCFLIPLPGIAYAKAHGINLNSYDDVKKGFHL